MVHISVPEFVCCRSYSLSKSHTILCTLNKDFLLDQNLARLFESSSQLGVNLGPMNA